MATTKETVEDVINVQADGQIRVRTVDIHYTDGVETHREVVNSRVVYPGQDLTNLSVKVKAAGKAAHTKAVVDAFKAAIAAQE